MTEPAAQVVGPDPKLAAAVQLGWRVAELYAQVTDTGEPVGDTLLPAHDSLDPADQLELQVRAAEGDARRAGIQPDAGVVAQISKLARQAPRSDAARDGFRAKVRHCHIQLEKELWALDEAAGAAYELGNGMSDTYGRVCRAYRAEERLDPAEEWGGVFKADRVERLKKLLGDLQSRLNPAGIAVVVDHLEQWRDAVRDRKADPDGKRLKTEAVPKKETVRDQLRRQTIVWRQLVTGDKQPQAYLDQKALADLRRHVRRLMWRRCRGYLAAAALVLFAALAFLPEIIGWYQSSVVGTGVASALIAVGGALGLKEASVLTALRTRVSQWSALLWDRAVVEKVSAETLRIDEIFPPVANARHDLAEVSHRLARNLRERARSHPEPAPEAPRR